MMTPSTRVEGQGTGEVVMMVVVVVVGAIFPLNPPPEMEEIIDGTREAQRPSRVEAVYLLSFLQEPLEEGMV